LKSDRIGVKVNSFKDRGFKIEFEVDALSKSLKFLLHQKTFLVYPIFFIVVSETVFEHKVHIFNEFLQALIPISLKLALDRRKVHRNFDLLKIICIVTSIHRDTKNLSIFIGHQFFEDLHSST